ncbi:hypothetical protein Q8A73_022115 [Channa argus]|nr:hypothetical protein Q8A73_022115 [Channa argus]
MPSWLLGLRRIDKPTTEEVLGLFNGFGVKGSKAQRCQSLAEDVVNFLGCGVSDSAAGPLLRIAWSTLLLREGDGERSHRQETAERAADGLGMQIHKESQLVEFSTEKAKTPGNGVKDPTQFELLFSGQLCKILRS